MSDRELIRKLVEEHGAIICTEYHVQVPTKGGKHDVWFSYQGLKWRLFGDRRTYQGNALGLLDKLSNYQHEKTDLAWMTGLTAFIRKVTNKVGVFVDAGWKNGVAQIAIVKSNGPGCAEIITHRVDAPSSTAAETMAVEMAFKRWPDSKVYTDCRHAANAAGAEWIPRERNKMADSLGNMRG